MSINERAEQVAETLSLIKEEIFPLIIDSSDELSMRLQRIAEDIGSQASKAQGAMGLDYGVD